MPTPSACFTYVPMDCPSPVARILCFTDLEPYVLYRCVQAQTRTHSQSDSHSHSRHSHPYKSHTHTYTLISRPLTLTKCLAILRLMHIDSLTLRLAHTQTHSHSDSPALRPSHSDPLIPRLSRAQTLAADTSRQIYTHMGISASSNVYGVFSSPREAPKRPPIDQQMVSKVLEAEVLICASICLDFFAASVWARESLGMSGAE